MDPHTIKSKFPFHSLSHTHANVSSPPSLGEKKSWFRQPFQECHVSSSKQNSMRLLTSVRSQAVSLQRCYSNFCSGQRSAHLWQEVQTLLSKGTVEIAPPVDSKSGFFSRYFLIPKRDGGLRLILDLRHLNRSVIQDVDIKLSNFFQLSHIFAPRTGFWQWIWKMSTFTCF